MKFASIAAFVLAIAPAFAQTARLTFDGVYDDPTLSLDEVACSNGENGLVTKGYHTIGSLGVSYVGGVETVVWNSPLCGACYNVTYESATVFILAVDASSYGFNVATGAMDALTNYQAYQLGSIDVNYAQVDVSYCKNNNP